MTADPRGAIAFAEKVMALLDHGSRSTSYKYAVLLGLIDLSLEGYSAAGAASEVVTTPQLAEAVTRIYWPQVAPYADGLGALKQSTTGQAEIVSLVADSRAGLGSVSLARARRDAPEAHRRLLREVEWKLVEMPLPRLQIFGRQEDRFIYEIGWDTKIRRRDFNDTARFNNAILLRPGVADHLVRLDGLLRPLLQRGWASQVAAINRLDDGRLESHLFGVDRIGLRPVKAGLLELQDHRCFYCERRLRDDEAGEVDHFLPWSRIPLDTVENLVVADNACNGQKRAFLAAAAHLRRWRERLGQADALAAIADAARWESSVSRTLGVARALYLPLGVDARLWSAGSTFELAQPAALRAALSARATG